MNTSTENFTAFGASTNSTTYYFGIHRSLDIFNLLFGLPVHSYVAWLIVTGTGSGVALEFFTLNLSVCEIVTCLNSLLSLFDYYPILKAITKFIIGLCITGRPLFQCLICVERYLAVVHPVTFLKFKPLRYRVICCTVVWIITLGSCLVCVFTLNLFNVYAWFFLLQFLFFLSIQLFCCLAVLRLLKQSGPGERMRERVEENHMKRRAFYIILITTVNMVVIYMPFIISGLFFVVSHVYISELFAFGLFFFVSAGFVQPVLYLNRAGKLSCLHF